MKGQKIISLEFDLMAKLKEEENASALIARLLKEYFKFSELDNLEDIEREEKTIKEKREEVKEREKEDLNRLKAHRKVIKVRAVEKEIIIEKAQEKEKIMRESFMENYKERTGKKGTEEQFKIFYKNWTDPLRPKYDIREFIAMEK